MKKLQILMRVFHITGKELSDMLFVDNSMISKWCSGKRTLKMGSNHLHNISELFLRMDEANNYRNLIGVLAEQYPKLEDANRDELQKNLELWLVNSDNDEEEAIDLLSIANMADLQTVYNFKGNKGRRDAVTYFESYAAKSKTPMEVITFNTEDATWFYEDQEFINESRKNNLTFVRRGGKLTLIHSLNTRYKDLACSILSWVSVYLSSINAKGYYVPRYTEDTITYTYFLIRNRLALIGMSAAKSTKLFTLMTTEKDVLGKLYEILQETIAVSRQLVYHLQPYGAFATELLKSMNVGRFMLDEPRREPIYIYDSQFSFSALPREDILRILRQYGCVSNQNVQETLEAYERINGKLFYTDSRYIVNLMDLGKQLRMERVPIGSFSILLNQTVEVPQQEFRQMLREAIDEIEKNPSIDIALIGASNGDIGMDFSALTQKGNCMFFWSYEADTIPFAIKEHKTVVAVCEYLEEKWFSVPKKEKKATLDMLRNLLETN